VSIVRLSRCLKKCDAYSLILSWTIDVSSEDWQRGKGNIRNDESFLRTPSGSFPELIGYAHSQRLAVGRLHHQAHDSIPTRRSRHSQLFFAFLALDQQPTPQVANAQSRQFRPLGSAHYKEMIEIPLSQ
jgi:hypothetical protein